MTDHFKDEDPEALTRRMEAAAGRLERLATNWQQGSLDQALERALKASRREMEKSIGKLVQDSLINAFGGTASGQGGIARLLAGLIPGFARGGILSTRTPVAHSAEAGPEVVLPLKRGRDGRLGVVMETAPAQPPRPVSVTISSSADSAEIDHAPPVMTEEMTSAISRAMDDAIDQRLALHQRPGGLLHQLHQGSWR